jgi:type I restriction enzyme S subunit
MTHAYTEDQLLEQLAIATPMAAQVLSLQRQIHNLRRTRDLLLPRLLSGQINVDKRSEGNTT